MQIRLDCITSLEISHDFGTQKMLSVESQQGIIADQRCSIENQKGAKSKQ